MGRIVDMEPSNVMFMSIVTSMSSWWWPNATFVNPFSSAYVKSDLRLCQEHRKHLVLRFLAFVSGLSSSNDVCMTLRRTPCRSQNDVMNLRSVSYGMLSMTTCAASTVMRGFSICCCLAMRRTSSSESLPPDNATSTRSPSSSSEYSEHARLNIRCILRSVFSISMACCLL